MDSVHQASFAGQFTIQINTAMLARFYPFHVRVSVAIEHASGRSTSYRPIEQPARPHNHAGLSKQVSGPSFKSFLVPLKGKNTDFLCLPSMLATVSRLLCVGSSDAVCIESIDSFGCQGAGFKRSWRLCQISGLRSGVLVWV